VSPSVLSHGSIEDGPNRDQFQQNIKGHGEKVPSEVYNTCNSHVTKILHWHDAAKMENWKQHPDVNVTSRLNLTPRRLNPGLHVRIISAIFKFLMFVYVTIMLQYGEDKEMIS
jgi:hypothetical protein